jgi:hypothetical protein
MPLSFSTASPTTGDSHVMNEVLHQDTGCFGDAVNTHVRDRRSQSCVGNPRRSMTFTRGLRLAMDLLLPRPSSSIGPIVFPLPTRSLAEAESCVERHVLHGVCDFASEPHLDEHELCAMRVCACSSSVGPELVRCSIRSVLN